MSGNRNFDPRHTFPEKSQSRSTNSIPYHLNTTRNLK